MYTVNTLRFCCPCCAISCAKFCNLNSTKQSISRLIRKTEGYLIDPAAARFFILNWSPFQTSASDWIVEKNIIFFLLLYKWPLCFMMIFFLVKNLPLVFMGASIILTPPLIPFLKCRFNTIWESTTCLMFIPLLQ